MGKSGSIPKEEASLAQLDNVFYVCHDAIGIGSKHLQLEFIRNRGKEKKKAR